MAESLRTYHDWQESEHERFSDLPSEMFAQMWELEEKRREVFLVLVAILRIKTND
jgi:hypothetical protein